MSNQEVTSFLQYQKHKGFISNFYLEAFFFTGIKFNRGGCCNSNGGVRKRFNKLESQKTKYQLTWTPFLDLIWNGIYHEVEIGSIDNESNFT